MNTTKEFNTRLINKRIDKIEDLTGKCLQDFSPELDNLYARYLDGQVSYVWISSQLDVTIDSLQMD